MNKILLDAEELKCKYLHGLDLKDTDGNALADSKVQDFIDAQIDEFETDMGIRMGQTTFLTNPDVAVKKIGYDFDELYDAQHVYSNDMGYGSGLYIFKNRLNFTPIRSIQRFAWKIAKPEEDNLLLFPPEWVTFRKKYGSVTVRPTVGGGDISQQVILLQNGAFFLPYFTGYFSLSPSMLEVDYTAGYCPSETEGTVAVAIGSKNVTGTGTTFTNLPPTKNKIRFDDEDKTYIVRKINSDTSLTLEENYAGTVPLTAASFFMVHRGEPGALKGIEIISKMAAVEILHVAGDALRAGISSESYSVDGVSVATSYTAGVENATFGARIIQYKKELNGDPNNPGGLREAFRDSEKGIQVDFI